MTSRPGAGGGVGADRLREMLHALSSDDREERRPWAGAPGRWWRDGSLDPETAATVGTVVSWCTMVDDDAGGVRAELLDSLVVLARDGRLPETDIDRLVTGLDAQWIPDNEVPHSAALHETLGREVKPRRDRKGYLWTLVDHVHALTSPDATERESAVPAAAAAPGIAESDAPALRTVAEWSTA